MAYQFKNKRVWITGASSGIGLALAILLCKTGALVFVTARNKKNLEKNFSKYENAFIFEGDITSRDVNDKIVSNIVTRFGGLDCAIFNAGNAEYIDIKNFNEAPFENMMQTNFLSMVKGIAASLPSLRLSDSAYLIGMSSSVAWHGLPQGEAYSASKAAIRNLLQGLNIELKPEKIAVSWICPGFVKTPLTDKNEFDMPFRISADKAAQIILNQLVKQKTEIHFPRKFSYFLKLLGFLPANWSAKLLMGTVPKR